MSDNEILILRPLFKMKDYSDKAAAVRFYVKEQLKHGKVITIPFDWEVVTKPADTKIEVARNPKGEWIDTTPDYENTHYFKCTSCGFILSEWQQFIPKYKFCPNCGADMRGKGG